MKLYILIVLIQISSRHLLLIASHLNVCKPKVQFLNLFVQYVRCQWSAVSSVFKISKFFLNLIQSSLKDFLLFFGKNDLLWGFLYFVMLMDRLNIRKKISC